MGTTSITNQGSAVEPDADQVVVYLGNRAAIELIDHPDDVAAAEQEGRTPAKVRRALPGKRCTRVVLAPGLTLLEAAYDVTHPERGVWQAHSNHPAPAWVASTDPALAQILAAHWGCEIRDPDLGHQPSGEAGQPGETEG